MAYEITYKKEGAVTIDADTYDEAVAKFEEMSDSEKENNTFMGWEINDVHES